MRQPSIALIAFNCAWEQMAPHGTTPCGTVIAENLRDLQRWTAHVDRGLFGASFLGVSGVS